MFPLSFSSSSSLSSLPPSLDSISELDRRLSDISEDDDLALDTAALPSNAFSDQQLTDLEHPPCPITSSRPYSLELFGADESCQAETGAGQPRFWRRFSLRGVVKCLSFILCFFLSLGKDGNRCLPTNLLPALTNKLSVFSVTLRKLRSQSARKLKILSARAPKCTFSDTATPKCDAFLNTLALKWTHLMAFLKSQPFTRRIALLVAVLGDQQRQTWSFPSLRGSPSITSSLSSLPSISSLPSSLLSFPLSCTRNRTPSIHRYLSNPSPLFLPCLLVVFLLAVMLTASQSLALALILATPLGLTLCYLESIVSSQRKSAILPLFVPELPDDRSEDQSSSGFNRQASPLALKRTPPRIRHQGPSSANWTQEMCDPAA